MVLMLERSKMSCVLCPVIFIARVFSSLPRNNFALSRQKHGFESRYRYRADPGTTIGRSQRVYINDVGELLRGKNKQSISCCGKTRVHWRVGKKILVNVPAALQVV